MPVRVVESKDNARLKELRKVLAAAGRSAHGRVGIEGPHLLEEALRAGLRVTTVFIAREDERLLSALRVPPETEILRLPAKLLDSALATETPQSIAALVEPPDWTWAHILDARPKGAELVVVLAGIQDPGNLGTILRSAEAFGATGVVCLPGTVSAWNAKAVRASAGSVFRVPLLAVSERECLEELHGAGVRILATTVRGAQPVELVDLAGPVALIIGNEGNGVSDELAEKADARITIPCPGSVESLNAAVAASVLLYEAARQRATRINMTPAIPQHSSKSLPHAVDRGARR
ncbi:MAG: RNA methyltransferase [Terracidiphilus sp.]|nr:RNA methyltransferase [Terracidiphilus sp.]MDR3798731.1 RNA methyltransferase [Terracidiphilus sp.]